MHRGYPVKCVLCSCAVVAAVSLFLGAGGCGPTPIDASFEPSPDENILGTLIDDRGSFEFNLNPVTGNVQRIDTDDGTITPPTDGQDFSVTRDTGRSVTVSPEGASDVIIAIRGDPNTDDQNFQVARTSLGGLAPLVRANAQNLATCAENQSFLDDACTVANAIDIDEMVTLISADLESRGQPVPLAEGMRALLAFYLEPLLDCCLAWDEYRSGGGDICTEG